MLSFEIFLVITSIRANKKSAVMGPLGIGKSTLLRVIAFHLVSKRKGNVLMTSMERSKQENS